MKFVAIASVSTGHAQKYATQVAKHWAHDLAVEEAGGQVRIRFPRDARGAAWPADALVTLTPAGESLECQIEASDPGQRDGLKGAIQRHVDRFAFREGPLHYNWRNIDD